jgi:hypothetical protein
MLVLGHDRVVEDTVTEFHRRMRGVGEPRRTEQTTGAAQSEAGVAQTRCRTDNAGLVTVEL